MPTTTSGGASNAWEQQAEPVAESEPQDAVAAEPEQAPQDQAADLEADKPKAAKKAAAKKTATATAPVEAEPAAPTAVAAEE
jgi:acetamidase/formamidase